MKISVIFGTRPEAIKLVPIILALRKKETVNCSVCVTAQHREMLDQVLSIFDIVPDVDLNIMRPNQRLAAIAARGMEAIDRYLTEQKPDMVLVQGDTTTTFIASLASFYNNIPIGHVEAGLRTGNLRSPWPEEGNRILTSRIATLHFAPTVVNRQNLIKEGVNPDRIFVTGNTVIDTLFLAIEIIKKIPLVIPGLDSTIMAEREAIPVVLITGHRRENFGKGFESICRAIADLAKIFPNVQFIYPVHLNPNVRTTVRQILGDGNKNATPNVHLINPLPYLPFVHLMNRACLILTDSGGIQEEAPSLGKPVLVMRDTTERPEAVTAGTAKLVGTDHLGIVRAATQLLTDNAAYETMARAHNPYGDGNATEKIIRILFDYFAKHNHPRTSSPGTFS